MQKLTKAEYLFFASSNTISPKLEDRTLQSNNTFLDQPITQLLIKLSEQRYIFFSKSPKINKINHSSDPIFFTKHTISSIHIAKNPPFIWIISKNPLSLHPLTKGSLPRPLRPRRGRLRPPPSSPSAAVYGCPASPSAAVIGHPQSPRQSRSASPRLHPAQPGAHPQSSSASRPYVQTRHPQATAD